MRKEHRSGPTRAGAYRLFMKSSFGGRQVLSRMTVAVDTQLHVITL